MHWHLFAASLGLQSVAVELDEEPEEVDTPGERAKHGKSDMRCHGCIGPKGKMRTALVPRPELRERTRWMMLVLAHFATKRPDFVHAQCA